MGNTNSDGIWTPDEDDTLEPDVWSAAMAESIKQGLGKRVKLQETRVSLRATAPEVFDVVSAGPSDPYATVPLTIGPVTNSRLPDPDFAGGNHADGIDIAGNYATILTSGLYTITGQITIIQAGGMAAHSWDFYGTINGNIFGLPDYGVTNPDSYTAGRVSDNRYLIAGDTVGLTVGVGTDHIGQFRVQDAMLGLSMTYAIPEA